MSNRKHCSLQIPSLVPPIATSGRGRRAGPQPIRRCIFFKETTVSQCALKNAHYHYISISVGNFGIIHVDSLLLVKIPIESTVSSRISWYYRMQMFKFSLFIAPWERYGGNVSAIFCVIQFLFVWRFLPRTRISPIESKRSWSKQAHGSETT